MELTTSVAKHSCQGGIVMKEISRTFRSTGVKIVVFENGKIRFGLHDAARALEFDDPRSMVMKLVVESNFGMQNGELIKSETGYDIFVSDRKSIIDLALLADQEIAREFLSWLMDQIVELQIDAREATQEPEEDVGGFFATTQVAKAYGMSGKELNKILSDLKIQFKVNKQWVLFSEYQDKGYTKHLRYSKDNDTGERLIMHTYWTAKGVKFIEDHLNRLGYTKTEQVTIDQQV
jgi:prophage antirepressor-like protein